MHQLRPVLAVGVMVPIALSVVGRPAQVHEAAAEDPLVGVSVDESTLPVTIPFRTLVNHIVVDVGHTDSDETLSPMLDTGAPMVYSADVVDRLGAEKVGSTATASAHQTVRTQDAS